MNFKKINMRILGVVAIIIVSAGTVWDFSLQLQNALTRETYETLAAVSVDYNKEFLDRISYNVKTLKVLSGSLKEMQGKSKQDIMSILQNAVNDGGFTRVVVVDKSGNTCADDGNSINVAEREYFKKAMKGEIEVSKPLVSSVDGKDAIVIAVPIRDENEIVGALFGVYPLATAGQYLLDFEYYSDGYGFIVDPNGEIILSGEHADKLAYEKNLFSFFEKTEFSKFSVLELKNDMKNGKSNSFAFTYQGQRRFVSFTPSKVNDWYTFSISSDAPMQKQERMTKEIVIRLVLRMSIAGVLIIAWIMCRNKKHNKAIVLANQKYQSLLEHINGGMVVATHAKTADETIINYVSSGFTDMTGYTIEDIQNIYNGRYLDLIPKKEREITFNAYLEQIKTGNTYHVSYRINKKDGSFVWVMDNGYVVKDATGQYNHSIIADITTVKEQEEKLSRSEKRFSIAINASSGTLFEVDLKNQIYTHFENAERIFGIDAQRLLDDTAEFSSLPKEEYADAVTKYFFHPDDCAMAKAEMEKAANEGTASYEARLRRFDNRYIWCKIELSEILDEFGVPSRIVGFMSDIDEIKKQAEMLESKVQTDSMTGLYNKIAMSTLSNKALNEYSGGYNALIVLDIDNFKGINDTLGHAFGDLVLIEICTKLKTSFRSNDIVGRMGGDEFAVLMKNVPDTSTVLKKATELSAAFRQTYTGEKKDYKISCSMGILMIYNANDTFDTLYRKADAALYQAKQHGKDRFVLYQEKDADSYSIHNTRTDDEELQNLKTSHDITVHIFELLYTAKDFNLSINMALAAIGQQYHVSRVAIFENDADDTTTSNIYEWCNDHIASGMDKLQNLPLAVGTESIMDSFDSNGLLYCNDVAELPPYLRQILRGKGVLSALKVTIANDEKTCGFIGFDECSEYRIWTSEEIEKLSFLSKVLSVFLFKKKTEDALLENLNIRLKILDILPDYICVVNPETHSIEYTNKKMRELIPAAKAGAYCFTTLRGSQDSPCTTCLVERIKRGDTDNLEIVSEDKSLRLKVKALQINWANDKKMVLLYGIDK